MKSKFNFSVIKPLNDAVTNLSKCSYRTLMISDKNRQNDWLPLNRL